MFWFDRQSLSLISNKLLQINPSLTILAFGGIPIISSYVSATFGVISASPTTSLKSPKSSLRSTFSLADASRIKRERSNFIFPSYRKEYFLRCEGILTGILPELDKVWRNNIMVSCNRGSIFQILFIVTKYTTTSEIFLEETNPSSSRFCM